MSITRRKFLKRIPLIVSIPVIGPKLAFGSKEEFVDIGRGLKNPIHYTDPESDYRKNLEVNFDSEGGYLVPQEIADEIEKELQKISPLRRLSNGI